MCNYCPPKFKYVVQTLIKKRDRYGNCYTFSKVNNIETGKYVYIFVGYGSCGGNVTGLLRQNGVEWSEIYHTESILSERKWNAKRREIASAEVYLHNFNMGMLD